MQDPQNKGSGFFEELKRRHVVRVGIAYVGAAFVLLQGLQVLFEAQLLSEQIFRLLTLVVLAGFPVALLLGWIFDLTPEGIRLTGRGEGAGRIVAHLRPRAVLAGSALVVVAGVGIAVAANLPRNAVAEVPPGADLIAVLPFTTQGEGVKVLEQGIVDLLSRNLDQVGAIRTVDPRTVLYRWEQRAQGGRLSFEETLEIASESYASSVLTGSIIAVGPEARISADLFSVDGSRLASVQVDGSSTDVLALVDSLSLALLREIWRSKEPLPRMNVSAITSGNLAAIRAYLAGERHYRASAWDSALVAFNRAVTADSIFPLAHYRLAVTASWMGRMDLAQRSAALARQYSDRLPAREQMLVRAEELRSSGQRPAAIDTLSAYVERYPEDAEGWFLLADDLYHLQSEHAGPAAGASQDPLWLFDKALEVDPSYSPALIHPLEIAFRSGDGAHIARYLEMLERTSPDAEGMALYRTAAAVLGGPRNPSALASVLADAIAADTGALDLSRQAARAVHVPLLRSLLAWPPAERRTAVERLRAELGGQSRSMMASHALLSLLTATGQLGDARTMLNDPTARTRISSEAVHRFALLPVLAGLAEPSALGEVNGMRAIPVEAATVELLRAVDRSDATALRGAGQRARSLPPGDALLQETLVRSGEGFLTVLAGDTVAGLREVESALDNTEFKPGTLSEALWFRWMEHMAASSATRARVLDALAQPWPGAPTYEGLRYYALARALEAEGRDAEARAAYASFLNAFDGADANLPVQEKVRAARAATGRLAQRS
jgi:tetratricopeptide (TPR) repeat protein